jgi:hypothetical protein
MIALRNVVPFTSRSVVRCIALLLLVVCASSALAQTLGGITGVVTDPSGAILPGTKVTAIGDQTGLKRVQTAGSNGFYLFSDLPIGTYTLTFSHDGFKAEKVPSIVVQADRTVSLPAQLTLGAIADSVTVEATPLMNATDTTNGYILDKAQIEAIPLPTGSFTGVAILTPGVNAELSGGTGSNSGLGNAPIWANGQRDISNSFRRRRLQPLQRQVHQPVRRRACRQQHRRRQLRRRRSRAVQRIHLSGHWQRSAHPRT